MFAGDQETIDAIVLYEESITKFDEKYKDSTQRITFRNARNEVCGELSAELRSKYMANINYFGRIMNS